MPVAEEKQVTMSYMLLLTVRIYAMYDSICTAK